MAVETNSRRSATVSLMAVKRCLGLHLRRRSRLALDRAYLWKTWIHVPMSHATHRTLCDEARGWAVGMGFYRLARLPERQARMSHCTAFVAHDEYARLCCEGMRWPGVRLQYQASRLVENGSRGVRSLCVRRMGNDG